MEVMRSSDTERHHSLELELVVLADANPSAANSIAQNPQKGIKMLDEAAVNAQHVIIAEEGLDEADGEIQPKTRIHVRLHGLPFSQDPAPNDWNPGIGGVRCRHAGRLMSFIGTVMRSGEIKMLETQKQYRCEKCQHEFVVETDIEMGMGSQMLHSCPSSKEDPCDGKSFVHISNGRVHTEYQEITVQEKMQCMAMGSMPCSMKMVLMDDLADSCKSGDDVEITGYVIRRWKPLYPGARCELELVVVANHLLLLNPQKSAIEIDIETEQFFHAFWASHESRPLAGRDQLLASLCPQICGMVTVKLALALTLIGGVHRSQDDMNIRGEIHMLLVGDPGMGKSQFLKYAALLSPRSVVTSGRAATTAGLTATAVKEDGSWSLEAGALVLADGGICCIDEFDGIKKQDLTSVHEAMEQQTVSIAKAGMVTTLNTRTAILGVMNPKGYRYDPRKGMVENTGLDGPLLSRFDILLVLTDVRNPDWDAAVSGHILSTHSKGAWRLNDDKGKPVLWSIELLQKYLHWAKTRFNPSLSPQAEIILLKYYQQVRQSEERQSSRMTIRMLESLVRISQAHARLMARDCVTQQDAVVAVMMMEASTGLSKMCSVDFFSSEDPDQAYQSQLNLVQNMLEISCEPADGAMEIG